jgi:glycosyltransferase involved in cell wall biosynthesis
VRIAYVTRRYWPAVGGVERVAMTLGESLAAEGHAVTVLAQCIDEDRFGRLTHIIRENRIFSPFERRGVRIVQFRPSRRRRALLLPLAWELVPLGAAVARLWGRRWSAGYYASIVRDVLAPLLADADVVHVLGGELLAAAAVETGHRLGKPVASTPFAHPGAWGDDSGSLRGYRGADAVIATSAADAAVYRRWRVAPERIEVIGLPVPEMIPGAEDPTSEVPVGTPLVVFLGARRPNKRVDLLLAAAPLVWERHPQARFAFVGPGEPLACRDPRALDVGRVSDPDRAAWLARASLLCLPSDSESFGLVVPEAWTRSVPAVVSDIPVLREFARASGGALVAAREARAIADAVTALLDEPRRAARMGRAGYEYWRANFAPQRVVAHHLAVYQRLLAA